MNRRSFIAKLTALIAAPLAAKQVYAGAAAELDPGAFSASPRFVSIPFPKRYRLDRESGELVQVYPFRAHDGSINPDYHDEEVATFEETVVPLHQTCGRGGRHV